LSLSRLERLSVLVIFAHPDEGESKADFVFTFYPAEGGGSGSYVEAFECKWVCR
jgi:hypothetical protein